MNSCSIFPFQNHAVANSMQILKCVLFSSNRMRIFHQLQEEEWLKWHR